MKNHFIVGYSLTGDNNGYDYSNGVNNNGYLGSRDNYQNDENFYGATGDVSNKLSSHIGSHLLINGDNQGGVGSDAGNGYDKYSANDHGSEYAGYYKGYENPDGGDSYNAAAHSASSAQFGGYSGSNNNGESTFNAYSSGSTHKDSDFGQYAAGGSGNNQRLPLSYLGYLRLAALENYPETTADSDVQRYQQQGSSGAPSYADSNRAYPPYSPNDSTNEFGKQKNQLYNLKGGNKYRDIYSAIPTEMRYTRGHATSHTRDATPYLPGPASSTHLSKTYGSNVYSSGKPYKYGYKYLSRYGPNSGATYSSRERDGHYASYNKGNGKIVLMKDGKLNYFAGGPFYADEPLYAGGSAGYRSKSGGYTSAGGLSNNYDRYSGAGNNYDDGLVMLRRYRTNGGHMIMQRAAYH